MKTSLAFAVALWFALGAHPVAAQDQTAAPAETADAKPADAAQDDAKQANEDKAAEDRPADEPEQFNQAAFLTQYRALLKDEKFDEAKQLVDGAIEKYPENAKMLHAMAFNFLRQADRREDAFEHLKAYVLTEMKAAADANRSTEPLTQLVGILVEEGSAIGGPDRAFAILDDLAKQAKESGKSSDRILAAIESQRVMQLGKANRIDEAKALLDARATAANDALAKSPSDADVILQKANELKDRANFADVIENGEPDKAWTEFLDFLYAQAKDHADAERVTERFATEHLGRAARLSRNEPDAAEALLVRIESLQGEKSAEDSPTGRQTAFFTAQIARLRDQIASARRLLELVGSPAVFPENVDGWINGAPQPPDALKGKVVLLDFFAVWCGPCIATFPHLRQWQDEYGDKGLQIVGLTQYYKYNWDETAAHIVAQPDITPEAERAATEQFAKHYELRHPIAFLTDRKMDEHYVVEGIPHVVLIDRQGKVRLFRIGSGDANAADLEKAIKECLAESAPEA